MKPQKKFDMAIRDNSQVAHDGQHRHGNEHATIEVENEGLRLVARHIKVSGCLPLPITPDMQLPLHFEMNSDMTGLATVICGICRKKLGTCSVRHIKKK